MTEKIVKSLGLTIAPRDQKHKDTTVLLQALMSQWLPLSDAILGEISVCALDTFNNSVFFLLSHTIDFTTYG